MLGPFGLRPRGTMSVRALPLAQSLVRRGHHVTLILPPWQNPEAAGQIAVRGGVMVENMPLPRGVPGWFHARLTGAMVRRALSLRPDVIHAFKPKAYAGLSHWLLEHLPRHPPVVVDSDDWEGPGGWNDLNPYPAPLKRFFTWQERWGLTHGAAVTVASRALETLAWAAGVPPERVFYLPNGTTWKTPVELVPHERPTLLLYTRFFEFGVPRLWRIVQQIRAQRPEARLLVVGRGFFAEEETLLRLARQAGWHVSDALTPQADLVYVGWGAAEKLRGYFAQSDVALYPFNDTLINRTKCPVKLLDLLAAGLPVVGDAVGQLREAIRHGESGLLVPPEDDAAFVAGVLSLLDDKSRRRALGQRAAADRKRFSWDALAEIASAAYRLAAA